MHVILRLYRSELSYFAFSERMRRVFQPFYYLCGIARNDYVRRERFCNYRAAPHHNIVAEGNARVDFCPSAYPAVIADIDGLAELRTRSAQLRVKRMTRGINADLRTYEAVIAYFNLADV